MEPVFESTDETYMGGSFKCFRVGTCEGLWRSTPENYEILAIVNKKKGNGHFQKALWWFEQSCKRDKKKLRIIKVWNLRLAWNLWKHGFTWSWFCNWEKHGK